MTLRSLWAVARTAFLKGRPFFFTFDSVVETVIELNDHDGHEQTENGSKAEEQTL